MQSIWKFSRRTRLQVFLVSLTWTLASCNLSTLKERQPSWENNEFDLPGTVNTVEQASPNLTPPPVEPNPDSPEPVDNSFYEPGNGRMVGTGLSPVRVDRDDGDITLNFQGTNLLEVVKFILGDLLAVNYLVDPRVQGSVSMQTSDPLRQEDMLPTLQLLLRMNNAALIVDDTLYRVVPIEAAVPGSEAPQLGDSGLPLPNGYSVRLMPLQFVSANEMADILEPLLAGGNNLLRIDSRRNLLILAGSPREMARLQETVRLFDVDRLAGMSVALFVPDLVDAKTLGEELDQLLADEESGLMSGMVRFVVIERLNGVLVVTPRPEYLAEVKRWVKRLDRDTGDISQRLFLYRVQNGEATKIADQLNQLFAQEQEQKEPAAQLAPGLEPVTSRAETRDGGADKAAEAAAEPKVTAKPPEPLSVIGQGLSIATTSEIRIIADEANNSLLILATGQEYRQILATLRQLDVVPMQVLIEVTIAEVSLSDDLEYGVEWFFTHGAGSGRVGRVSLDLTEGAIGPLDRAFSYALSDQAGVVQAVLNVLATESNLSIVSSPSLLVLNNQEARIQVGQEVPVSTQQQQATNIDSNILNSIEYRETGVTLTVKPRINSGGLVIMEVEQEVSNVPQDNNADPLTPRIQTRKVASTVAVQSGDTIILGGLIEGDRNLSESGIPGLHKIPGFGALFGKKSDNQARRELLVLITPRAIPDRGSALAVTNEFRRKLNTLELSADTGKLRPEGQGGGVTLATAGAPICERIEPLTAYQADDLNQRFASVRLTTEQITLGGDGEKNFRVVVGPFPSLKAANEVTEDLDQLGYPALRIHDQGPLANSIDVAYFDQLGPADAMAEAILETGFNARVAPIDQPSFALEYQREDKHLGVIMEWLKTLPTARRKAVTCGVR